MKSIDNREFIKAVTEANQKRLKRLAYSFDEEPIMKKPHWMKMNQDSPQKDPIENKLTPVIEKIKAALNSFKNEKGSICLYPRRKHWLYVSAVKFMLDSGSFHQVKWEFRKLDDDGEILGLCLTPANNPD